MQIFLFLYANTHIPITLSAHWAGRGDAINKFAPPDRATRRRAGAPEFTALRLSRPRAAAADLISTA
jgi:hypothetical protein